jgi:RND family efflux transporter MFP subunit
MPFPLHAPYLSAPAAALALSLLAACAGESPTPTAAAQAPDPDAHLVEVATVALDRLGHRSVRTGTLRWRREAKVYTQEEGAILELPHFEGDPVAAGEVVVRMDAALLQAQLDKAVAERRQAELDLERLRDLAKRQLAAEEQLARAETALQVARAEEAVLRTRVGYTTVRAPFAGIVTARHAELGDVTGRHVHVLTLADPASLVTEVSVSELLLPALSVGDSAQVRVDALGQQVFPGRIVRIHPTVDPRTGQGTVEVALDPIPPGARAGQLSRVTLSAPALERLVIPFEALRRDSGGEYVFRLEADTTVRRTPVRTGLRIGQRVEVLEGLELDQRVVVKGFFGLSEGKEVRPVELTS